MIPIVSYGGVQQDQSDRFFFHQTQKNVRLVGIVFCRPECALAKTDIFPALPYYHFRSGKNIAFYFGGYQVDEDIRDWADPKTFTTIPGPDGKEWYFTPESFNQFRKDIEERTTWRYSGECDFILTNARYDPVKGAADLDFCSAICLQLDKLREISTIQSVGKFFEKVFQYAEHQDTDDPASEFSDWAGLTVARSAFKNFFLSWLPKALQDDANAAFDLVTKDISR